MHAWKYKPYFFPTEKYACAPLSYINTIQLLECSRNLRTTACTCKWFVLLHRTMHFICQEYKTGFCQFSSLLSILCSNKQLKWAWSLQERAMRCIYREEKQTCVVLWDRSFAFAFVCKRFSLNVRHLSQTYSLNITNNHPFRSSAWSVFTGKNILLDFCTFTLQCRLEK